MPRSYMDRLAVHRPDLTPPFAQTHDWTLMVELGGTDLQDILMETLDGQMQAGLVLDAILAQSEAQRAQIWAIREAAAEITFTQTPIIDCDVALPLDRLPDFLPRVQAALATLDAGATDITVGHLGDGNLHYAVYPSRVDPAHLAAIREMIDAQTVALGGSISAEHGVGQSKRATLERHKPPAVLAAMRAIKSALDPKGVMNPGKVVR
jgi:FAD/FMN-containing dehydrogenase